MRRILSISLLCIAFGTLCAQEAIDPIEGYCSYGGDTLEDELFMFVSDREAKELVGQVVRYTGLAQNFTIVASNVPNAIAYVKNKQRYIAYSQDFILDLKDETKTDWAAVSVLAHEIGHHLSGHTIKLKGSNPGDELAADKFSGFILYRMGATLDEAKAAMLLDGDSIGTKHHPPKSARLAAITNGWLDARDLEGKKAIVDHSAGETQPQDKISKSTFLYQCTFKGDDNMYFVDDKDRVIWFDNYGNPIVIGSKTSPTSGEFDWMYNYQNLQYGVDHKGRMWSLTSYGGRFIAGKVEPIEGIER